MAPPATSITSPRKHRVRRFTDRFPGNVLTCRAGRAWRAAVACTKRSLGSAGLCRAFLPSGYVKAVKIRPREAADQAAARAFLARHNSLRVARLGRLVRPLDHPALVAETGGGQLLGMLTYVPRQDWQQCVILTLCADKQWGGARTALIEAAGQLARRQGCARLWSSPPTTTLMRCGSTSAAASAWCGYIAVPLIAAAPLTSRKSPRRARDPAAR